MATAKTRAPAWWSASAAGLLLFALGFTLFSVVPTWGEPVDAAGHSLSDALSDSPWLVGAATVLAVAGRYLVLAPILVVAAFLLRSHDGHAHAANALLGAFALGELVVLATKYITARARPEDALLVLESFSFPSGHASRGALTATLAVWLILRLTASRGLRLILVACAAAWGVALAASRLVLGVHHATDVLAGVGIGVAIAGAAVAAAVQSAPSPSTASAARRGASGSSGRP